MTGIVKVVSPTIYTGGIKYSRLAVCSAGIYCAWVFAKVTLSRGGVWIKFIVGGGFCMT